MIWKQLFWLCSNAIEASAVHGPTLSPVLCCPHGRQCSVSFCQGLGWFLIAPEESDFLTLYPKVIVKGALHLSVTFRGNLQLLRGSATKRSFKVMKQMQRGRTRVRDGEGGPPFEILFFSQDLYHP